MAVIRRGTVVAGSAAILLTLACSACTSSSAHPARTSVPASRVSPTPTPIAPPPVASFIPADYRVTDQLTINMDGGPTPETVVAATGPAPGGVGYAPVKVVILAYDPYARRWTSVYDTSTPQPDQPNAQGSLYGPYGVHNVTIRAFQPTPKKAVDLLITGDEEFGDGGVLAVRVIGYDNNIARQEYAFDGDNGGTATVTGNPGAQRIRVTANYYTMADAHCCPARTYTFDVGTTTDNSTNGLVEIDDDRPLVGVQVSSTTSTLDPNAALAVTRIFDNSPATGKLRVGDVITAIIGAPQPKTGLNGPKLIDQIALHKPGDTIVFVVQRPNTVPLTVPVVLGSQVSNPIDPNSQDGIFI